MNETRKTRHERHKNDVFVSFFSRKGRREEIFVNDVLCLIFLRGKKAIKVLVNISIGGFFYGSSCEYFYGSSCEYFYRKRSNAKKSSCEYFFVTFPFPPSYVSYLHSTFMPRWQLPVKHGTLILPTVKNSLGISCVPREETRGGERDMRLRQIWKVGTLYRFYSMKL